jgi:hypothetical protein
MAMAFPCEEVYGWLPEIDWFETKKFLPSFWPQKLWVYKLHEISVKSLILMLKNPAKFHHISSEAEAGWTLPNAQPKAGFGGWTLRNLQLRR